MNREQISTLKRLEDGLESAHLQASELWWHAVNSYGSKGRPAKLLTLKEKLQELNGLVDQALQQNGVQP